jgi:hypothetical protein
MSRVWWLLVAFLWVPANISGQQPQTLFDETGEVRLTTALVPKTTKEWITLISVAPTDSYLGGVDKWIWLSHPGQVATPQELSVRGRVLFNGTKVTILAADTAPFEIRFDGPDAAHLIGAWRMRRESEPMTHERLVAMMLNTLLRNSR